jgi:hypothetical protein
MNNQRLCKLLKYTNGEIKYYEQMLFILIECEFSYIECEKIKDAYLNNKEFQVDEWEDKIKESKYIEEGVAIKIIDKIKRNVYSLTYMFPVSC